jgi:hypothetical protein
MQLSSFGYVVVAIEHEDGSGAYAERAPEATKDKSDEAVFDLPAEGAGAIYYARPPPGDWQRPAIIDFRKPQLSHRLGELRGTLERIRATASSTLLIHQSMEMYAPPDAVAVHHDGTSLVSVFQQCDTSRASLVGHSFGGATVALAASPSAALPTGLPAAVVMLDVWAGCLDDEQVREQMSVPTLSIYSEDWKLIVPQSSYARELLSSATALRSALVLRNTVHQSFSDVSNWVPGALSRCASSLVPAP